jgi:EmrB/QacA subfamily drug resistance transporter
MTTGEIGSTPEERSMAQAAKSRATSAPAPDPRRWWTLSVLCLSLLIIGIDNSILNVAIPTLVRELGVSTSQLQWIVDAYVLAFAGLLLTMGNLGDRIGRKGVMTTGLVVFGSASAVAAFSGGANALIVCRAIMGCGAAMIMPATLSILANVFTDARERRRAIAYWSLMNAAGTTVGPITGGLLLRHFSWGSIFFVNVPVVVIAIVAGHRLVPTSRDPNAPPSDPVGSVLSIAGLGVLLYAIISGPENGWAGATTLGLFAVAFVVLTGFVLWELRQEHPMLPVRFFADHRLSAAAGTITIAFVSLGGTMFLLTQVLQLVQGYSPLSAALHVSIPLLVVNLLVMPISPRLTERYGPKRVVTFGMLSITAGLVAVSVTKVHSGYGNILLGLLLMALGFGSILPAVTDAIMGVIPRERAGSGSAINDLTRQVGIALGVGVAGSIALSGYRASYHDAVGSLDVGASVVAAGRESLGAALRAATDLPQHLQGLFVHVVDVAFVDGVHLALLVGAGLCITGALFGWFALPSRVPHQDLNVSELAIDEFVVDNAELGATPPADDNGADQEGAVPDTRGRRRVRRRLRVRPR